MLKRARATARKVPMVYERESGRERRRKEGGRRGRRVSWYGISSLGLAFASSRCSLDSFLWLFLLSFLALPQFSRLKRAAHSRAPLIFADLSSKCASSRKHRGTQPMGDPATRPDKKKGETFCYYCLAHCSSAPLHRRRSALRAT